jgi:hypothetical protein
MGWLWKHRHVRRQNWCSKVMTISAIDIMITIFRDFRTFSAKKLAFFLKAKVMIHFLQNSAEFCRKNANFSPLFWQKYF